MLLSVVGNHRVEVFEETLARDSVGIHAWIRDSTRGLRTCQSRLKSIRDRNGVLHWANCRLVLADALQKALRSLVIISKTL